MGILPERELVVLRALTGGKKLAALSEPLAEARETAKQPAPWRSRPDLV